MKETLFVIDGKSQAIHLNGHDGIKSSKINPQNISLFLFQVRNCKLSGLHDLDLGQEYVRNKIAEYLNTLISYGVAGFRVDAAKHMWPSDLEAIYSRLNTLSTVFFPPGLKPFIYQEVIDMGGEAIKAQEYTRFGRVTEFRFGKNLGKRMNHGQK